jgi:hypothetical protein
LPPLPDSVRGFQHGCEKSTTASIVGAGVQATARGSWLVRFYIGASPVPWTGHPALTGQWVARQSVRCWEICKLGLGLHAAFPRASQNWPFVGARLRMTLDTDITARCSASTSPIPAPRLLFFMRPVLDINRRSGPHSSFYFDFFCTPWPLGLGFQRHGWIFGGGKTGRQIHRPPLGVVGMEYLLRTTTFWILFGLLFWHYLIWWIYPRVFSMKHVPGLVKPHELRFSVLGEGTWRSRSAFSLVVGSSTGL